MNGMCDAENNHRHYRIERNFGAGRGGGIAWRTYPSCLLNCKMYSVIKRNP